VEALAPFSEAAGVFASFDTEEADTEAAFCETDES
jgi:hypothetical protein